MGESTDGILVYGYIWDEENRKLIDSDEEWQDIILRKRGIENPYDSFPESTERLGWQEQEDKVKEWRSEHKEDLDRYREAKKALEEEFGVEIDYHCSNEYSMPIIAAKRYTASRGYPVEIGDLTVDPKWHTQMTKFIEELGIEMTDAKGPGWFLCSYWG